MGEEYILNHRTEIVPVAADRYELRLPLWGHALEATPEQVALLRRFEDWAPPGRSPEHAFFESCIEAGVLLGRLPTGKARFPQRVRAQPTMFGAPHHQPERPAALTVLGVPLGSRPGALREASQRTRYTLDPTTLKPRGFYDFARGATLLEGVTIADAGDVFVAPGEDPHDTYDRITLSVRSLLHSGTKPLLLGGDGSITYPILRAFSRERLGVIHFDAETDLGDIEPSGLDHANVFSVVLEKLEFVERVHQIGLRGVVPGSPKPPERVAWYGVDRVRSLGAVMLAEALPSDLPYYVSIDTRTVDPNGLLAHELKAILRAIGATHEIVGVDLVGATSLELGVEALLAVADHVRSR